VQGTDGGIVGEKEAGPGGVVEGEAFQDDAVGGAEGAEAIIQVNIVIGPGDNDQIGGMDSGDHANTTDAEAVVGRGEREQGAGQAESGEGFGISDVNGVTGGDVRNDGKAEEGLRGLRRLRGLRVNGIGVQLYVRGYIIKH